MFLVPAGCYYEASLRRNPFIGIFSIQLLSQGVYQIQVQKIRYKKQIDNGSLYTNASTTRDKYATLLNGPMSLKGCAKSASTRKLKLAFNL
jgi:hypothetical protein